MAKREGEDTSCDCFKNENDTRFLLFSLANAVMVV